MDDLISRQAVIESIKNLYPGMPVMNIMGARRKWLEKYKPYLECENAVEHLPPVTQKPKTGHWIESRCNMWVCSACGYTHTDLSGEKDGMNYCPNCGIQMMKAKTMKNAAAQDAGKYADAPTLMPGA